MKSFIFLLLVYSLAGFSAPDASCKASIQKAIEMNEAMLDRNYVLQDGHIHQENGIKEIAAEIAHYFEKKKFAKKVQAIKDQAIQNIKDLKKLLVMNTKDACISEGKLKRILEQYAASVEAYEKMEADRIPPTEIYKFSEAIVGQNIYYSDREYTKSTEDLSVNPLRVNIESVRSLAE